MAERGSEDADLDGTTLLVTGATDGIGRLTARDLAARGARVLVHGRDAEKARETVEGIREDTGPGDRVDALLADLASLAAVRDLAGRVVDHPWVRDGRLDVLVNNAGIGSGPRGEDRRATSEDGHELRFAVNHLAPHLLTRLLLPTLRAADRARRAPARVVNVTSAGQADVDFDDVMLERGYSGSRAYGQSKLAMVMATIALADEVPADEVTVNCLHPGSLLDTKMVRETFGEARGTVQEGADAVAFLAVDPSLDGVTGRYFDQRRESRAREQAYDPDAWARLVALSDDLVRPYLPDGDARSS